MTSTRTLLPLAARWGTMTLAQQLGNVASEFARFQGWDASADGEQRDRSAVRLLELLDLTIADPRWRRGRTELARLREAFCACYVGHGRAIIPATQLAGYLLQFAQRARQGK